MILKSACYVCLIGTSTAHFTSRAICRILRVDAISSRPEMQWLTFRNAHTLM